LPARGGCTTTPRGLAFNLPDSSVSEPAGARCYYSAVQRNIVDLGVRLLNQYSPEM